ncbi:MAG TPA: PaaI family thioesterase [Actinomycetota bacterium]|jgi:acyl-CoA thioesterase
MIEVGRAVLASQPFSVHLGTELVAFESGRAELAIAVAPHLEQQNGFVHGGIISYLMDNALTFAGGSVLGPNVLTQEFKVSYLRPAKGERLVARATVLHSSKRQAVCRCDVYGVTGEEETLCATALGTILATSA